jgi:predicted transcriptional regulator
MRHRLKLVKHGWVDIQQATLNNGRKVYFYYLGKEEVVQSGFSRAQLASDKIALPSVD